MYAPIFMSLSCSQLFSQKKNETGEAIEDHESTSIALEGESTSGSKIKKPSTDAQSSVELKQAQTWNRMNELEDEVRVQRERIKLLEQGLMTGIAPSDLNPNRKAESTKQDSKHPNGSKDRNVSNELPSPDGVDDLVKSKGTKTESPNSMMIRLQVAKEYFQGGRNGMAVAELASIMKDFGPKSGEGAVKLLLGRSYLGLKEFESAKIELIGFLEMFPGHQEEALARLELARAYLGLNLRDRSRKELVLVTQKFKGSDEADIAAHEMDKMKSNF
jgi:hypothetical protein